MILPLVVGLIVACPIVALVLKIRNSYRNW